MSQIINEAFKELKGLDEELKKLDEAAFSFDRQGMLDLGDFLHQDAEEPDFVDIIDDEAETEEDVKDNYVGDVILQCCICNGYTVKNPKEVFINAATGKANEDMECPWCWNKGGFTIVSQVKNPYDESEGTEDASADDNVEPAKDEEELTVDTDFIQLEDKEAEPVQESLKEEAEEVEENSSEDKEEEEIDSTHRDTSEDELRKMGAFDNLNEESDDFDDEDAEEEVPFDAENSDKDLWSLIYGKLTGDGSQYIAADGKPRINNGIFDNSKVSTDVDGNIVVRAADAAAFDAAEEILDKFGKYGVTTIITKDKYDSQTPYRLVVTVPDKYIAESCKECKEQEKEGNPTPVNEGAEKADVMLEEGDVVDFDEDTGDITVALHPEMKKGMHLNVTLADDNSNSIHEYVVSDINTDEKTATLEYISSVSQMNESVENVTVETDSDTVTVTPNEEGGVTVDAQPKEAAAEEAEEVLAPVDETTMAEIEENVPEDEEEEIEEVATEEVPEEPSDEEDIEFDDFNEEEFNELGESYLREVYDNVKSFKTTKGYLHDSRMKLEGLITFNSGKTSRTSFIFEGYSVLKNGKVKLIGMNEQITPRKNSFILTGRVENKSLMLEALTYNYNARNSRDNKLVRVYGTKRLTESKKK